MRNDQSEIISAYESGLSMRQCMKKFGISPWSIRNLLINNQIDIRTRGQSLRRHNLNENFFRFIDDEGSAYWLGFLLADGSVWEGLTNDWHVSLGLKRSDKHHLQKFIDSLDSDYEIWDDTKRPFSSVTIHSNQLALDLGRYGVVPRKAHTADPRIELISKEMLPHFWRGVIDGDGSILLDHQNQWQISLIGTEATVVKFKSYVDKLVGIESGHTGKDGKCYRVYYKQIRICKEIAQHLYGNANVYLDRKKEASNQLLNHKVLPCFAKDVSKEELLEAYEDFGSWIAVSKYYNISVSQLRNARRNMGLEIRKGDFKGKKGVPFYKHRGKGKLIWTKK